MFSDVFFHSKGQGNKKAVCYKFLTGIVVISEPDLVKSSKFRIKLFISFATVDLYSRKMYIQAKDRI